MQRVPRILALASVAAVGIATPLTAQSLPRSAWLEWPDLQMIISADSGGTVLWVSRLLGAEGAKKSQSFGGTLEPGRTVSWVATARALLDQPLTDADTGSVRSTAPLLTAGGDGMSLSRRRVRGAWSDERFLVMETLDDTMPLMISGDVQTIGSILDSLEAVARQTTVFEEVVRRDSIERVNEPRPAPRVIPNQRNRAPRYPEDELQARRPGRVVLSFMVGPDGKADLNTVRTLHATSASFLKSVREALPTYRFQPAVHDGAPIATRVLAPFVFEFRSGKPPR